LALRGGSYQNGQRTVVSDLASGLLVQAKLCVKERLDRLLNQSQAIVQANTSAYQQGYISLDKEADLQRYFWEQVQRNFIPIAEENGTEENGTIVSIGEWVLRAACLQKLVWNKQNPTMPAVQVGVNVSAQQLLSPDFADRVEQILQETGLEGTQIQLEITESAAVSQPAAIGQTLKRIQALGMKICIDDFGTGYSHLSHLLQLPIDILKIDRSFVGEIGVNPRNAEIAKTILALTNCLEIEAIAEGVETSVQLEHLRSLQCKKFQGYLFSPPLPVDGVLSFSPAIPSTGS
jgi:EAL domain-containing protein (putative c-di-GMP-specific phosphodiesterase class I)